MSKKPFTTGQLIQINMEEQAIHALALRMETLDIAEHHKREQRADMLQDEIEAMLLAWEIVGLDTSRITVEAYRLSDEYHKSKVSQLKLIKNKL